MKSKVDPSSDITETLGIHQAHMAGKRLKPYLAIALVVILAAAALMIWKKAGKTNPIQYKTEQARRGELTVIVTATGTLQPTNTISVGSELSGIMKSVEVNYNDRVKVGQVLARLDTSKLEAQVTQSKAALESAKAKVLQAQATVSETQAKRSQFKKVRELSKGKVPSQSEMDAAEAAFDRAKADAASAAAAVSQAQATLQANETDLYKAVIRSPVSGVVLTRSIEPGQTVAASFQAPVLFTLAQDLTQMELHVNVDEADIGKIRKSQKATFSVSAYPDRTFEGRITQARFASTTTSGVVTYETVLKVDNTDLSLRPGMTATADITVKKVENATLVPSAALRFTPPVQQEEKPSAGLVGSLLPHPPSGAQQRSDTTTNGKQQRVWILKDGKPSPVSVTTGATSGGFTEVLTGDLQPGMEVVVDIITGAK
ncbi:MAG: efflux RND transporter periplasmic adaptor subunit [Nitrospiraceae bacterium]|nr:efflux RND transporter periplasmic adaptor subunit [Nitrospiraceae bacterium]